MACFREKMRNVVFVVFICAALSACGDKSDQSEDNKFNVSNPASLDRALGDFKEMSYSDRCRLTAETIIEAAKVRDKDKKATQGDNYVYFIDKYKDDDSLGLMLKSLDVAYENKNIEPEVLGVAYFQDCLQKR